MLFMAKLLSSQKMWPSTACHKLYFQDCSSTLCQCCLSNDYWCLRFNL